MKLKKLLAALIATTALTSIALVPVQPAAALAPTPPDGAVFAILPGATVTAATVVMQTPGRMPIPIGVLNPTTGTFVPSGLSAVHSRVNATEAKPLKSSTLGQSPRSAALDSFGHVISVLSSSTPGVSDASVIGSANLFEPRLMSQIGSGISGSANEFAAIFQARVPQTNSAASYEKATVYGNIVIDDPSDYAKNILRDGVGSEWQATIPSGNMLGRAWAIDTITTVQSGADGYAVGQELGIYNNGSDQPLTGTSTSKNGIHLVGGGTHGGTAAIVPAGKWHDGLVCQTGVFTNTCWKMWNGKSTLASLDNTGTLNVTKFGYIGGGVSTATFSNNCLNTTGTPYLGECLYGSDNSVTAQYVIVGGKAASDNAEYGSAHFASANFDYGAGDGQWGWRVLYGTIPAGGGTVRLKSQSGTTFAAANTIPIPLFKAISLDCKLVAHTPTGGQHSANWSLDDALFDSGATASTVRFVGGSWTPKQASSGFSGVLTPSVAADTTLGSVNISVTATSGGPWDLVARCFSADDK